MKKLVLTAVATAFAAAVAFSPAEATWSHGGKDKRGYSWGAHWGTHMAWKCKYFPAKAMCKGYKTTTYKAPAKKGMK